MKFINIFLSISIIAAAFCTESYSQPDSKGKYTIVIHGGAGTFDKSFDDSLKALYMASLGDALRIGQKNT